MRNNNPIFQGKGEHGEKKRTWWRGKRRLREPLPENIIEQSVTESGGWIDDLGQPPIPRVPDSVWRSIVCRCLRPPLLKLASSSSSSNFRRAFARRRHQSYGKRCLKRERKLSERCLEREKVAGKVFAERESCRKGVCRERKLPEIKCKCLKLQCNDFYSYLPPYPTSHKFRNKLLL